MTKIEFSFEADHALHFDRDEHDHVGHLLGFGLGSDVTLTPDISVLEPKFQKPVTVVGLITEVKWAGAPDDEMDLSALISTANRQLVMNVVHKAVSEIDVTFKFTIYDYDIEKTKWYGALHTNDQTIDGLIKVNTIAKPARLELEVAPKPEPKIPSPALWEMSVKIKPGTKSQTIHFLTGALQKVVKEWGDLKE